LEGRHSAVAHFNLFDCRTNACDNAAELVAEDIAFLEIWDDVCKSATDGTLADQAIFYFLVVKVVTYRGTGVSHSHR
jgi:hypothetical protein